MSRIDDLVLPLEEQANKLGYDSVADALDDGYKVQYTTLKNPYLIK